MGFELQSDSSSPLAKLAGLKDVFGGGGGGSKGAGDKIKLAVAVAALLAAGGLFVWQIFGSTIDLEDATNRIVVINAKTGEVDRRFRLPMNEAPPYATSAGERVLYPAELCWYDPEGNVMAEPTAVLLNEYAGKPGETLCPHCNRRVVKRNPGPSFAELEAARQRGK
ncbi:MAG: hypothetical protein IOD15_05875 [Phycisphaerales bacterium]|nr:hypothetical protein [Phycisphaerales bacterium]